MLQRFLFTVVVLVLPASQVVAQALPFTKTVVTQEEYARALETDDRRVLNVPCAKLVEAFNTVFKNEEGIPQHENCQDLASYIRRLNVYGCPQNRVTRITRVLANGQ